MVAGVHGAFTEEYRTEVEANAARIVACVNALEGMNPDALAKLVEAVQTIAAGSDTISITHTGSGVLDYVAFNPAETARAALAELTGDVG